MKHNILALLAGLALILSLSMFAHYFPNMTLAEALQAIYDYI